MTQALFRPRLTLQTLTRGDGLLGLRAVPGFGPRSAEVTVARIAWTYLTEEGLAWETFAPERLVNTRPKAAVEILRGAWNARIELRRDPSAEADARDALWDCGLRPLPPQALQWRAEEAAIGHDHLWSLPEEAQFGSFWADKVPRLEALGWQVIVRPGFAHESVRVRGFKLSIDAARGESWMMSLGIEVDGDVLDLAPLLADLIKRDGRWLDAKELAEIEDESIVLLHAPGGRRIEAPAAPLKAVVSAMLDLLTDPKRVEGPIKLNAWEAQQAEALRVDLAGSMAARAGPNGSWQLQGEAGLTALAERLAAAGTPRTVVQPEGLGVQLRPYQLQGLGWLQYLREQHLGGILADDMGLGKTAQVLAHLLVEQQAGRLDHPSLVVMPTSLISNWTSEARRMAPSLRVLALQGADRAKDFGRIVEHDVVFTTYPLLWRDVDVLCAQAWHLLILDEAQMVKNAASRSATALRRLKARQRLCVTGTPMENHLGELWAHFDFLMPGFLGDTRTFSRVWRKPIETNGETMRAQLLAKRVRPFILRRRKQDVAAELPPKTETVRHVQLEGEQRALYESVRVAANDQVRKVLERRSFAGWQIAILDALLKLRQVCCDPHLLKGHKTPATMERAKMEWLRDMLPEMVEEGRRVLVFSQFTEMLGLIERELIDLALPCLVLTGETPPSQRGEVVARFQAKEVPVMLISLKAGGVGLNLTAADTVIHVDPWWNPAVERQATDRAHRIGQDQPVFVYKLVVEGSIEERIIALQERKAALAEGVLGHDTQAAPKFDATDLEGLLAPLTD